MGCPLEVECHRLETAPRKHKEKGDSLDHGSKVALNAKDLVHLCHHRHGLQIVCGKGLRCFLAHLWGETCAGGLTRKIIGPCRAPLEGSSQK